MQTVTAENKTSENKTSKAISENYRDTQAGIYLRLMTHEDTDRIVATRRWLIGAVIVPLVGIFLPVILMLTRGGS